ncbi:hypothetical protein [Nocardia sp. NPDC058497]|uniref:hypothetical protein n=1 Tax=Nocardia sp. NPDC058497 TaxID=3346529 RepID=UPI0036675D71
MSTANLTDIERQVLDVLASDGLILGVLAPGGLLTIDALARRTGRRVREVRRAITSLRMRNLAWANRRGQWSAR